MLGVRCILLVFMLWQSRCMFKNFFQTKSCAHLGHGKDNFYWETLLGKHMILCMLGGNSLNRWFPVILVLRSICFFCSQIHSQFSQINLNHYSFKQLNGVCISSSASVKNLEYSQSADSREPKAEVSIWPQIYQKAGIF